jgi:hypothetical protein
MIKGIILFIITIPAILIPSPLPCLRSQDFSRSEMLRCHAGAGDRPPSLSLPWRVTCPNSRDRVNTWLRDTRANIARGGHGLPKVVPGLAMPYPSTPCGRATPETDILLFHGWPARRAGGLRRSFTPLDTPRRAPMTWPCDQMITWQYFTIGSNLFIVRLKNTIFQI